MLEVAPVQRQLSHLPLVGQRPDGRVGGLHLRNLSFYRHRLGLLSDGQRKIHHRLAADIQCDPIVNHSRKTHLGRLNIVVADDQFGHSEAPLRVAGGSLGRTGTGILHLNGCVGDGGA